MYRRILAVLGFCLLAQGAHAAQPIDCAGPIARAQKAIDKVTGDLQGMDKMMPKSEMTELHGFIGHAKKLNKKAQNYCAAKNSAYREAEAIAEATAANGYATAADILHFHYMQMGASGGTMKGMNGARHMPAKGTMGGK